MSVGKWLDTVITDSAADVGAKTARRVPNDNAARRPPAKPEPRKPEFDEHAQRRKNGDDQHQGGLPPDLLAKVSNRLDKLTQQLDLRERRTAEEEIAAVNSRLETLALAVDQLVRVHGADRQAPERADETSRELADPASPLDQAMSEIAERQRALDAGPGRLSQNLSGLEDQLRQINAQIET